MLAFSEAIKNWPMSKFTIQTLLGVLRVLLAVFSKAVRLISVIADLVDDGCINGSVPRPRWYDMLGAAVNTIEDLAGRFGDVRNELLTPSSDVAE